MSNPFRRSPMPVQPDPASANIFGTAAPPPSADGAAPSKTATTPPKRTKKKKVVIQTPPPSPEFLHTTRHGATRRSASASAARVPSPPPMRDARTGEDGQRESASTADDSAPDRAAANTSMNWADMSGPEAASVGGARAPGNPFSTALASNEAGPAGRAERSAPENKEPRKRVMDVDMFKDILLTGGPSNAGGQARQHDSSSNTTDTSSLFEPAYGLHPQSPRLDYDDCQSASDGSSDGDNEDSQLMGEERSDDATFAPYVPPKEARYSVLQNTPQPASKHAQRGPKTVSFADFDQTILPASNSDVNKPLPPPPGQDMAAKAPPLPPPKDLPAHTAAMPIPPADAAATPKRTPPPAPIARRRAAGHGRARSVSNLSNLPQDLDTSTPPSGAPSLRHNAEQATPKPPPPPRRRVPVTQPAASPSPSQPDTKLAPAPPPRRHGSKLGERTNIRRQPPADSTSVRRVDSSPAASGNAPPPPPPPPRKKRTSMDGRTRASFDSARSASIGSLKHCATTWEASEHSVASPDPNPDILGEMAAFQAEIDRLRAEGSEAR